LAKRTAIFNVLKGPAPVEDRLLWAELMNKGYSIPNELRNTTLHKSKRDALGRGMKVSKITGLEAPSQNPVVGIVAKFEETIEGREDLLEKLSAQEDKLSLEEKALMVLLETAPKTKSLARLIAESKASAYKVMQHYALGAKQLGKIRAAIEISRNQPLIVKDLLRNALDDVGICGICAGTGTVKGATGSNHKVENQYCPLCEGKGMKVSSSEHKEYAMTKVLEMGQLVEKEPKGPVVAVQQNVNIGGSGAFVEKILKTGEEILYGRNKVVDAEIVSVEDKSVLPENSSK
jgi:hypothetical protein